MSSIYTEKWVLFLDILGFEAYINDEKKSEEFARKVLQVFNAILQRFDAKKEDGVYKGVSISQFSDTFIVSAGDVTNISAIASQLMILFVALGLLSRGAITYGKVFHNGSQFIGPAITRAYNLEKSEAIYPRVIIDRDCEDNPEIFALTNYNHLKEDFDGYLYVDFFDEYIYGKTDSSNTIYSDGISSINELYEKHKNTPHRGKYTWLKQKADEFVQNTK